MAPLPAPEFERGRKTRRSCGRTGRNPSGPARQSAGAKSRSRNPQTARTYPRDGTAGRRCHPRQRGACPA
eukprot:250753-Alexandrium_andersonii.AAC.1